MWGTDGRVGQLYVLEKTEIVCCLDKYGDLDRNCGLRNYRFMSPYRDDDRLYRLDGR